jgi:predicted polyphosphate/ATP-dependent NAD kinase
VGPKLGLIVNPVAGLGGRVGLKGSDGAAIQEKAMALGAIPRAQERASESLRRLKPVAGLEIITYPGEMGEDVARRCSFEPTVIGSIRQGETTARDTRDAARAMLASDVDLILFAGGDGTARDVYQAVGLDLPTLGIPAGVKIHSAVFAINPVMAGELATLYLQGKVDSLRDAEVMDIDEDAVRQGVVSAKLYGYLRIPYRTSLVQNLKMPSSGEAASVTSIAYDVTQKMEEGCLYVLGPGTTTRAIADEVGLPKTLIGVDVIVKEVNAGAEGEPEFRLVGADMNESQLLEMLKGRSAKIVVTPIGGQGYLFGRGNQQLSPRVVEMVGRDNIIVVSSKSKLYALGTQDLLVDTGDRAVDEMLSGYFTIVTGYNERAVRKVSC